MITRMIRALGKDSKTEHVFMYFIQINRKGGDANSHWCDFLVTTHILQLTRKRGRFTTMLLALLLTTTTRRTTIRFNQSLIVGHIF